MECPVCGAANESGAAFCYRCGTPLKTAAPAATGPTVSLNRAEPPSYESVSTPLLAAEETHARVYDVPPVANTSSQPFIVPPASQPQYSQPGNQPFTVSTAPGPQYTQPGNVQYAITSNSAIFSLILGIASFLGLSLLGAIPAIILGRNAQQEIRASGGRVTGDGMAQAGVVLGWINVALSVLLFCFICAFFTAIGTSFGP